MKNKGEYLTAKSCLDLIDPVTSLPLNKVTSARGPGKLVKEIYRDISNQNEMRLCIAYTYLAANCLRLFKKTTENYLRITNHLNNIFQNFYLFSFHLEEKIYALLNLAIYFFDVW